MCRHTLQTSSYHEEINYDDTDHLYALEQIDIRYIERLRPIHLVLTQSCLDLYNQQLLVVLDFLHIDSPTHNWCPVCKNF